MPYWTYILHCHTGKFYTGHTDNLERRIWQHENGTLPGFTRDWLPVKLVWSQEFVTRDEAKAAEKQIKGWSRKKKLALIRGDWDAVSCYARSKSSPSTGSGQSEVAGAVIVDNAVLRRLTEAMAACRPHETCGLLLGSGSHITAALPTSNVHPTPETHFEIDPQALIDAHRAARVGGPEVLGYYHSHPHGPARPSATDQASAAGDGRIWAIIGQAMEITLWRDDENGFTPLSYTPTNA